MELFKVCQAKKYELIKEPIFWAISIAVIGLIAVLIGKSMTLAVIFSLFLIFVVLFWKYLTDEKYILIMILLSILPGMLGRISFGERGSATILITDLFVGMLILIFFSEKFSWKRNLY